MKKTVTFDVLENSNKIAFSLDDNKEKKAVSFDNFDEIVNTKSPVSFSNKDLRKASFKTSFFNKPVFKYCAVALSTAALVLLAMNFPFINPSAQYHEKTETVSSSLNTNMDVAHDTLSNIKKAPAALLKRPETVVKKASAENTKLFVSSQESRSFLQNFLMANTEYKAKVNKTKQTISSQTSVVETLHNYVTDPDSVQNISQTEQPQETTLSEKQQNLLNTIEALEIKVNSEPIKDLTPAREDSLQYKFTLEDMEYTLTLFENPNTEEPIFTENADLFYQLDERTNGVMVHFQGDSIESLNQFTWCNDQVIFDLLVPQGIDIDRAKYAISRVTY